MNTKLALGGSVGVALVLWLTVVGQSAGASQLAGRSQGDEQVSLARLMTQPGNLTSSARATFFERLRQMVDPSSSNSSAKSPAKLTPQVEAARLPVVAGNPNTKPNPRSADETIEDQEEEDVEEDGEEEEDDEDDDDDEEGDEDEDEDEQPTKPKGSRSASTKMVSDIFGNKLKLENNRTILVSQNKRRDLGLLAFKAILLGPLIGLTLKAALLRGLLWALATYGIHLFAPGVLSALGLGTGLVGFARQMQPDYLQMLMPQLANLPANLQSVLPTPVRRLIGQYRQMFQPMVEAIRSIPEGQCRFRAVCETASRLVRQSGPSMSGTLQRLSATVYLNFGTEYSKAWLDGIVQSDCALKYAQCQSSPFSMLASRLSEAIRPLARPPSS